MIDVSNEDLKEQVEVFNVNTFQVGDLIQFDKNGYFRHFVRFLSQEKKCQFFRLISSQLSLNPHSQLWFTMESFVISTITVNTFALLI